jgi:hypothetical protein
MTFLTHSLGSAVSVGENTAMRQYLIATGIVLDAIKRHWLKSSSGMLRKSGILSGFARITTGHINILLTILQNGKRAVRGALKSAICGKAWISMPGHTRSLSAP